MTKQCKLKDKPARSKRYTVFYSTLARIAQPDKTYCFEHEKHQPETVSLFNAETGVNMILPLHVFDANFDEVKNEG